MNNGELLSVLEHIERETDISGFHTREVPRDAIHNRLQGQGVI